MTDVYLSLEEKGFEETKKAAREDYESDGDDAKGYRWRNCELTGETIDFSEGKLEIYGDLQDTDSGKNLGYISLTTVLDLDTIIDFIECYMKKLGKLKTVLEATK